MQRRPAFVSLLVGCVLLPASAMAGAGDREFDEAIASYRNGRHAEAFGRLLPLAKAGDPDAARIVVFMHQYGPTLYGRYWDLHPPEVTAFTQLAASARQRRVPEFQPIVVTSARPARREGARQKLAQKD